MQHNLVVVGVSKIKSKRLFLKSSIVCWRKGNKEEVKPDPIIDPFASEHSLSAAFAMFMMM